MKIYEALAQAFIGEQVDTCFALLGDANMHWAGALADRGVKFIYPRHEHAAVAGATAYARVTNKVGCATVTCGPGLTQIMTILPIAVRARIPLVIFAGEAPLHKAWYNQGIDQAPFVTACGARYRGTGGALVSASLSGESDGFTPRECTVISPPCAAQGRVCGPALQPRQCHRSRRHMSRDQPW